MHWFYGHVMVRLGGYTTLILVVMVLCQAHWWYYNVRTAIFIAKKLKSRQTSPTTGDRSHECKPRPRRWIEHTSADTSIGGLHNPDVAAS
jgi:hypothetical protein